MSAGSKSCDGLDEATCAVMETSMLEEEGYFNPPTSSGAGVSETAGKKQLESLCRVCANTSDYFIPIFEGEGVEHQLDMKIQKHLPIQVLETDGLPAQVCYQCASTLIAWHDLVTACVEADKKLHQLLQEEEDEEYEDREEKVIEFFNEPPVDSDGGDEFNEPSTSAAVVKVKQSSPPQKRRTTGKGKQQQRKAQVENASSVSDAKNNTVPVVSKEACASLKGVVESASSTERSSTALKTIHSASLDTQERYEHETLIKLEKDSGASEDEDNDDNGNGLENLNSDFESNAVWFPNMHSYCKPGNTQERDDIASEEQLFDSSNCSEMFVDSKITNSYLKSRKRVKPHIIEFESFGFPVETEFCSTNIFMCHVCGESILGDVTDMEKHLKSHEYLRKYHKHRKTEQFGGSRSHDQNLDVDVMVDEQDAVLQVSDIENVSEFYCKTCQKCFENKIMLKLHNKKHHTSSSQLESVSCHENNCDYQVVAAKRKQNNVFVCRACRTEFSDLASFQQHRPAQAKKSRIGEMVRSACAEFRAANMEAQQCKKKCEPADVRKTSRINKLVRNVCGELLAVDLGVEKYLLKQLRREHQEFRIKNKRKWFF